MRLTAIRSLFSYAALCHPEHALLIQRVLAIPPKRFDKPIVTFLAATEVLMLLATQTGLRVSELTGLNCSDVTSLQPPLRRFIENATLGDARRRGETHQWMWDRVNLPSALCAAGFTDVQLLDHLTSAIPDWRAIGLDNGDGNDEYKPAFPVCGSSTLSRRARPSATVVGGNRSDYVTHRLAHLTLD